jgi:hypothetical protein
MTDIDIDTSKLSIHALRELLSRGTERPWAVRASKSIAHDDNVYTVMDANSMWIAECGEAECDARLICAAVNEAEGLLNRCDELEHQLSEAIKENERITPEWGENCQIPELRAEVERLRRAVCQWEANHDQRKAERDAALRELERWRHNLTIEGDSVCPDSLAMTEALAEAERLRALVAKACGLACDSAFDEGDIADIRRAAGLEKEGE